MKIFQRSGNIRLRMLLTVILFMPVCTFAQVDDTGNNYQKDFNSFKGSINQYFDNFVQHNDSMFIQFLAQSWKEFNGVQNKMPTPPKPVQQPKASPSTKTECAHKRWNNQLFYLRFQFLSLE